MPEWVYAVVDLRPGQHLRRLHSRAVGDGVIIALADGNSHAGRGASGELAAGLDRSPPMLVLGAKDDGSRIDGDVSAAARTYQTDAELFPDMGHVMMLEPGWEAVPERIVGWLSGRGL